MLRTPRDGLSLHALSTRPFPTAASAPWCYVRPAGAAPPPLYGHSVTLLREEELGAALAAERSERGVSWEAHVLVHGGASVWV